MEKVLEREEHLLSARIMNPWTMALEMYKTVLLLILDLLLLLGLLSVNIQTPLIMLECGGRGGRALLSTF